MSGGRYVARWGVLAAAVITGVVPALAGADGDGIEPVSIQTLPSVSDDGRFVAYLAPSVQRRPDDLSPWILDRANGEREELSLMQPGIRDGRVAQIALSGDGCSVVIVTELALDLFRDDDVNERWDVYRTVRSGCVDAFAPGEWELVSSSDDAEPSATNSVDPTDRPSVDGSGAAVVFTERSAGGWSTLRVADLAVVLGDAGRVVAVPGEPLDGPTAAGAFLGLRAPAISDDGRYVAFSTDTEPVPGDSGDPATGSAGWTTQVVDGVAVRQVWRWDRLPNDDEAGAALVPVSVGPDGRPGDRSSDHPAINADGHVVVFESAASSLIEAASDPSPDEAPATQVYRARMDEPVAVELVSSVDTRPGDGSSERPDVDASGLLVTFTTRSTDLVAPAPVESSRPEGGDVLLADMATRTLSRISVRADGLPEPFGSADPVLAGSGRVIVYERPTEEIGSTELATVAQRSSVSAADLDLGSVELGFSSATWFTTVVNRGDGPFVPRSMRIDDPRFQIVGGTCVANVPLMPGAHCTIEVVFTPDAPGEVRATLQIAEVGFDAGELVVSLTARSGVASISVTPLSIDGGRGHVDHDGAPQLITVTATGGVPSSIRAVSTTGDRPADFPVVFDSCTGATLPALGVCHVAVAFHPTDAGPRSATLNVIESSGASTGAVLIGLGEYRPAAGMVQAVVAENGTVDVIGLGFTKGAPLWVSWTGDDHGVVALADERGAFQVRLRVPAALGGGRRTVTVTDPSGQSPLVTTADVIVAPALTAGGSSPAHRRP